MTNNLPEAPQLEEEQAIETLSLPCPPELSGAAKSEWKRVVGELMANDVVTRLDIAVLALYCSSYAGWLEATEAVNRIGAMIKSPNGHAIQSPYVAIANRNAETMLRCAAELGLTPASRDKIFPRKSSLELAPWP